MATKVIRKKDLDVEQVAPAVTPPILDGSETSFFTKPKVWSKSKKRDIPEGLWTKCPSCENLIYDKELDDNLKVCPKCSHHFKLGARERIHSLVETCSFEEIDPLMESVDVLKFTGNASYEAKLNSYRKKMPMLKDAVITGLGSIGPHRVALGVMDFNFLGGSMGSVVGEKLTRMIETATDRGLPLIIVASSGGARMYEGMFSLMQMAKTCGALAYHGRQGLPYISVLTDPTTAGVMASFASVGDLILAEPCATIGFAGRRVVEATTQSELPADFQTAEFLMKRGLIDSIVPRLEMKPRLIGYLDYLMASRRPS